MNAEVRRQAYLAAMQVDTWVPRTLLPFAAPSRPELLRVVRREAEPSPPPAMDSAPTAQPAVAPVERPKVQVPRVPTVARVETKAKPDEAAAVAIRRQPAASPPPRFALQLLRAGSCLLLVELPTGESFQSRDPAYLLLRDMLRAAGLPDSPQQLGRGEPIRWPLLSVGSLDQGAEAARDYVQGVVAAELEGFTCACLWLIGLPALRFAAEAEADALNRELEIEGLGPALAMPGLEQLMDEPLRKAGLWAAMRRAMPRWVAADG